MDTQAHQCDVEPGWVLPADTKSGFTFIGAGAVAIKKLRGSCDIDSPEKELWFAVLSRGIDDLFAHSDSIRATAEDFIFYSGRLDPVAECLGLTPEYIRSVATVATEAALEGVVGE